MKRVIYWLLTIIIICSCKGLLPEEDTKRPSVEITSPLTGTQVSGVVIIEATASDNESVYKVAFYVDGLKIGEDLSSPYSTEWNTIYSPLGTINLLCTAYDDSGNTSDSAPVQVVLSGGANPGGFSEDFEDYETGELELGDLSPHWLADSFGSSRLSIVLDETGNALRIDDQVSGGDYSLCNSTFPALSQGRLEMNLEFLETSYLLVSLQTLTTDVDATLFPISVTFEPPTGSNTMEIAYNDGSSFYTMNTTVPLNDRHTLTIDFNCTLGFYSLYFNGQPIEEGLEFDDDTDFINNLSLMTLDGLNQGCDVIIDNIEITEESVDISLPAAPSNFTAEMVSYTSVNLTWTDNSDDETGFYLYRYQDFDNFTDLELISTLPANSTSYSDSGLTEGETYFYAIDSFNHIGSSDIVDTGITLLYGVTGLTASQGTYSDGVHLSWNSQSYVDFYYIYRYLNSSEGWVYLGYVEGNFNGTIDTSALSGVNYYYSVSAVDFNSEFQDYWEVTMTGSVLGYRL